MVANKAAEFPTATIAQAAKLVAANIRADIATFLFGQPGLGKTTIIRQIAAVAEFAQRFTGGCFVLSTTEYNPIDLSGLYQVDQYGRTVRCPSASIPLDKPVLILIDEFGDCPTYEQSGWYRLLLDKTLGENKLAEGSYVCAASNRPEDSAASREVSTAAKDRCVCVTLRADARTTLDFALRAGWNDKVRAFIGAYPTFIDEGFNPEDSYGGATPRSFERLSKLESLGLISSDYKLALLQIVGNIGMDAGYKYATFRQIEIPPVALVFDNPATAPIPERDQLFMYCSAIIGASKPQNFDAIATYALRLDRVSGFALCWDVKRKYPEFAKSNAATKMALEYSDLF